MSRSLKKGPFIDEHLMKKVVALNEANQKKVFKLGLEDQQSILNSWDTQ